VVIAGALIFLGTTYFGSHNSKPVEHSAKPTVAAEAPTSGPIPSADDRYLAELSNRGVIFQSQVKAKVAGHDACNVLGSNHDTHLTQNAVVLMYGLTDQQAKGVVTAAHMWYCPQAADAPAPAEAPPAPSAEPTTTAVALTDTDDAFLTSIKSSGMSVPTLDAAQYAVSNAHQVCTYRASHDESTTQTYAGSVTSWMLHPNPAVFTEMAEFHYCGQYLPAGY
jgi:Protein of unknown function (DUF732)